MVLLVCLLSLYFHLDFVVILLLMIVLSLALGHMALPLVNLDEAGVLLKVRQRGLLWLSLADLNPLKSLILLVGSVYVLLLLTKRFHYK